VFLGKTFFDEHADLLADYHLAALARKPKAEWLF
jgi:hypothetical protein